jgi:hypothetical protein
MMREAFFDAENDPVWPFLAFAWQCCQQSCGAPTQEA